MFKGIRFHRVLALIVLVVAGAWVLTGQFASVGSEAAHAEAADAAQPPAPAAALRTVGAVTPVFVDHAREIRLSALTAPDKRAELAARTNGVIASLAIAEGDAVKAGQTIMSLEGPDLIAAVATAEASLRQASEQLEVAERLNQSGNVADLQLTGARATKAAAEAQLSQARAAADRLQLQSPFDGVVEKVEVERGEWVQAGAAIATVLALDPIVIRGEVGELDVGEVAAGARAEVRLMNGVQADGSVRFVAREATGATRTFPVEIALPNADHSLPAGLTAEVTLFTRPVKAVVVPRSVITLSPEGRIGLRVVGADDVARFAGVSIIDDTPEGLVVTGVPEGVRIIVAGQDLVSDGEKVAVTEAKLAAGTGTGTGPGTGSNAAAAATGAQP